MISFRNAERRVTFKCDDFIEYHTNSIGRIERVFTHEVLTGHRRLFMTLTSVDYTDRIDDLTGLHILRIGTQKSIIGLPTSHARKLYIVPMRSGFGFLKPDDDLLFVDWRITFL